jgi:ABC-2 type transport system permease protein
MSTTAEAPAAGRAATPMTLWRLERLRLLRTHRWMILFGVFLLFGALGPLTARYFNELMARAGGEMTIIAPDPRPVDGILQFIGNVSQLGILAVVVVAAAALAFDSQPERSAFLRTRLARPGRLVLAPWLVSTVASIAALVAGTAIAWVMTGALLGPLPVGAMLVGTAFGGIYLAFVVAVVAAVAGFVRGQVATVFATVGLLVAMPLVAMVEALRPWVPSELLLAITGLLEGEAGVTYLRAAAISVLATAGLLVLSARRIELREL